jgi:tRNA G18 (ribose-2'-O)-methylase SpoU
MGAALRIPFATVEPWPAGLARVREAGFTLVALTPGGTASVDALTLPKRPALLLGAEGPGLTPAALAASDIQAQISMDPEMDSLNVVVAAGIALHRLAPRPAI